MLAALNLVFQTQRRSLMGCVLRIVGDAQVAEDLAQETYLRVRRAADAGAIEHLEAFLYQTARNLALDHRRRRRMRGGVEIEADADALRNVADLVPSQEAAFIDRETVRMFQAALQGLPERARQVVILSRIEEWSNRRIAEHLGISERTVFNDLKMAMAHCRDSLARRERS